MHRIIQFVTLFFIGLYAYLSRPDFYDNYYWLAISAVLFLIGMFFKLQHTLTAAAAGLAGFASFHLFRWLVMDQPTDFGWNELIWMIVIPYAALVGAMDQIAARGKGTERFSMFQQLQSAALAEQEEVYTVNEEFGFMAGTSFIYKLEAEVIRALRDRREFKLLLVEIERFSEIKVNPGYHHALSILNLTAEAICKTPDCPDVRAHLGEGVFALLLPMTFGAEDPAETMIKNINDTLSELLLLRPRNDGSRVNLNCGSAVCPAHGIEARSLMDWAQADLEKVE